MQNVEPLRGAVLFLHHRSLRSQVLAAGSFIKMLMGALWLHCGELDAFACPIATNLASAGG